MLSIFDNQSKADFEKEETIKKLENEILCQLKYLQVYSTQFLLYLHKLLEQNLNGFNNNTLKSFFRTNLPYFLKQGFRFEHILHCNLILLRKYKSFDCFNEEEKLQFERFLDVGIICNKIVKYLEDPSIISDILVDFYKSKTNFHLKSVAVFQNAFNQDFYKMESLFKYIAVENDKTDLEFKKIYENSFEYFLGDYHRHIDKLLTIVHSKYFSNDIFIKQIANIYDKECLFKHMLLQRVIYSDKSRKLDLNRVADELINQLANGFLEKYPKLKNSEKLLFGLLTGEISDKSMEKLGWFLLSCARSINIIDGLLRLIDIFIEHGDYENLKWLLQQDSLGDFSKLLLVNMWNPKIPNVVVMELLLEICLENMKKFSDVEYDEITELCRKISMRWETMKKFTKKYKQLNGELSSNSEDHQPIQITTDNALALTTMGNTSHLHLITGLPDCTNLHNSIIMDLLDRNICRILSTSDNPQLANDKLEELCDKSIYLAAKSIRQLWNCLTLFSAYNARVNLVELLNNRLQAQHHQHLVTPTNQSTNTPSTSSSDNTPMKYSIVEQSQTFLAKFKMALKQSDFDSVSKIYHQTILPKLQFIHESIDQVLPYSLRLELLELIYSMIYSTEYDLFGQFAVEQTNQPTSTTHLWVLPETTLTTTGSTEIFSRSDSFEKYSLFSNQRFVCPYFMCRDILVIVQHHLSILRRNAYQSSNPDNPETKLDKKLSQYINQDNGNQLEIRMGNLLSSIDELKSRMNLITTNKIDFSIDRLGEINEPIRLIFDIDKQSDWLIKRRQKPRSRSSTATVILNKPTVINTTNQKEPNNSSNEEAKLLTNKIVLTGATTDENQFTQYLSGNGSSAGLSTYSSQLDNYSHVNSGFLVNCMNWLLTPIEQIALVTVQCNLKEKYLEIAHMYSTNDSVSNLMQEFLTEIHYSQTLNDYKCKLIELSSLHQTTSTTTASTTATDVDTSSSSQFGKFNWQKLSQLNARISSDNQLSELISRLLSLNAKSRPHCLQSLMTTQQHQQQQQQQQQQLALAFDCGLLLDLIVFAGLWCCQQTKYQALTQEIVKVINEKLRIDSNSITDKFTAGLKKVVISLLNNTCDHLKDQKNIQLKMLSELQVLLKLIMFHDEQDYCALSDEQADTDILGSTVNSSPGSFDDTSSSTRWQYLIQIRDFMRRLTSSDNKRTLFQYLSRLPLDYVCGLCSHLEVFVQFLNKYKQVADKKNPSVQCQIDNEFSVLKKSPLEALGDLIFLNGVDPKSKEMGQISSEMGFDLSSVIMENCLPFINALKTTNHEQSPSELQWFEQQVYNDDGSSDSNCFILDPLNTVTKLLEKAILIVSKCGNVVKVPSPSSSYASGSTHSSPHKKVDMNSSRSSSSVGSKKSSTAADTATTSSSKGYDASEQKVKAINNQILLQIEIDATSLVDRWHYNNGIDADWSVFVVMDLIQLTQVNMDIFLNQSPEYRSAFWINLHNLMQLHLLIVLTKQNIYSTMKYRSVQSKLIRLNFCYRIGQIGVISIDELKEIYLGLPDVTFTDYDADNSDNYSHFYTEQEEKYRLNNNLYNGISLFGLIDGSLSGCPLRIYHVDSLENELKANLSYILLNYSILEPDKRQITLPQLFKWYNFSILHNVTTSLANQTPRPRSSLNTQTSINSNITSVNDEDLLYRILSNASSSVALKFFNALRMDSANTSFNKKEINTSQKNVRVLWKPRFEQFGCQILLDISYLDLLQPGNQFNTSNLSTKHTTNHNQTGLNQSEQLTNQHNSRRVNSQSQISQLLIPSNYRATYISVEYLRTANPLLACMCYTLIGDDFVKLLLANNSNQGDFVSNCSSNTITMPTTPTSITTTNVFDDDSIIQESRSFKYSRLCDQYAALGNWLLRYWTDWISGCHARSNQLLGINNISNANCNESLLTFCCNSSPMEIRWAAFCHPEAEEVHRILIDYATQELMVFMTSSSQQQQGSTNTSGGSVVIDDITSYYDITIDRRLASDHLSLPSYVRLADALRNTPHALIESSAQLKKLRDILLVKSAKYWASGLIDEFQSKKLAPPDTDIPQSVLQERCHRQHQLIDCIYAIADRELLLSQTKRYLELLNIQQVLALIQYCTSIFPNNQELKILSNQLDIFKEIHDLISELSQPMTTVSSSTSANQNISYQSSGGWLKIHLPIEFSDWLNLKQASLLSPELVFRFLVGQRKFALCRRWVAIFMSEQGQQRTDAEYLISLIDDAILPMETAKLASFINNLDHLLKLHGCEYLFQVICSVIGGSCNSVCPMAVMLCCSYVISHRLLSPSDGISLDNPTLTINKVLKSWVGASMIRHIILQNNSEMASLYQHLIEYPELILEQLLMNCEIDLFRKMLDILRSIRKSYLKITEDSLTTYHEDTGSRLSLLSASSYRSANDIIDELSLDSINAIITTYMTKALELPALKEDNNNINPADLPNNPPTSHNATSRQEQYIGNADTNSIKDYATHSSTHSSSNLRPAASSIGNDDEASASMSLLEQQNNYPEQLSTDDPACLLSPDKWVKDRDVTVCMCCEKEHFSMFNRRHHCRRCGRVVCASCSTHRTSMIDSVVQVRVCNDCYSNGAVISPLAKSRHQTKHVSTGTATTYNRSLFRRHSTVRSGARKFKSNANRNSESPASVTSTAMLSDDQSDYNSNLGAMNEDVGALETGWKLSRCSQENDLIRQMFFYDDAPSVTMAFSLAEIHGNSYECGNFLLEQVDYLAEFLKPMKNGEANNEVDYLLVIDIAKRIAYQAKLKFNRLNKDEEFARAQAYLDRLELLGVLVSSQYSHCLPPLDGQGVLFTEKIKLLRDTLIREERLELAQVISLKAGLSQEPISIALGLQALEDNRYDDARRLLVGTGHTVAYGAGNVGRGGVGNRLFHQRRSNSMATLLMSGGVGGEIAGGSNGAVDNEPQLKYPLNEIMAILENTRTRIHIVNEMSNKIRDSDELISCPERKFQESKAMSKIQIEEALYYLNAFNARVNYLQFLVKHSMWSKALDYVMKKNVTREEFIEGLIAPAVNSGHFKDVKDEMLMSGNNWHGSPLERQYYTVLCSYLERHQCFSDLLEIQENNKDHLKAVQSLIHHFYLKGAKNYVDLAERLEYLYRAEDHMKKVIEEEPKDSAQLRNYSKRLVCIQQQELATLFLTNQMSRLYAESGLDYLSRHLKADKPLPTLFSTNPTTLVDFCLSMLFCRPNVNDTLQVLCPLMQTCHLYPEKILPRAVPWLIQKHQSIGDQFSAIFDLANNIVSSLRLFSRTSDDVLLGLIDRLPDTPPTDSTKNQFGVKFTGLFKIDIKKIEALIKLKDYKRAYSISARLGYQDEVRRILDLAQTANDESGVIDLCRQWLSNNNH